MLDRLNVKRREKMAIPVRRGSGGGGGVGRAEKRGREPFP